MTDEEWENKVQLLDALRAQETRRRNKRLRRKWFTYAMLMWLALTAYHAGVLFHD